MLSFRQKIFISYLLLFLIFISLIFPLSTKWINHIVISAMNDRATDLISKIQTAPDDKSLIRRLKEYQGQLFFRFGVISNERKVLYDSHTKHFAPTVPSNDYISSHPEVLQAYREGIGYHEDYSKLLGQKYAYFAKAFNFHGKKYVVRTAFPYKYVVELRYDFEMGFIGFATLVLLLFSVMTWFIINHLTNPIQKIITAIKPYQEGVNSDLPAISPQEVNPRDDFGKLASTLNSLSTRIQNHINTLKKERNEKEAILESLVEGVIAVDGNMHISYANHTALHFLHLEKEQLIGLPFSQIRQDKCYLLLLKCRKDNKPLLDTITIKHNHQKLYLDIVAAPTMGNSGAILVLQDKSAHYKLLEMRKDFIANASHELKTPITIIRGFAETLHDNPNLPSDTMIEVTEKIVRNCKRMTALIKDLLILSDVENIPSFRLATCNLMELIRKCCSTVQEVYRDAQIHIDHIEGPDPILTADPYLLELAIVNLIENAAKYSPQPAQITICVSTEEGVIRLDISDKGIGIPVEEQEHIFERFYTVDKAHSQKMGGSGLGLSIVKTIVEKHFGKISLKSEVGKGSTFTIRLLAPNKP